MSIYPSTSIIPRETVRQEILPYKVVLTDHKGFEQVILARAETRKDAYDAYRAWLAEYRADPSGRAYPPDTWAECTRGEQLSWKTNPFIGTGRA